MKNTFRYIIFITLLFMYACSKDELLECDCGQNSTDKLCREYRFENNECIGFIDYTYDSNLKLKSEKYSNKHNELKKIINYEYNSKSQITRKAEIFTDNYQYNNTSIFHYNYFDSLNEKLIYQNNEIVRMEIYDYDSLKNIKQITNYISDTIQSYSVYKYNTLLQLWKITNYKSNGELLNCMDYNYYYDNTIRINKYDSLLNFNGYELKRYNNYKQLTEKFIYDKEIILITNEVFEYVDNRLSKKTTYDQFEQIISYVIYKYN